MSVKLDGVLQTLSAMERYYRGGSRWTRWALDDGNGNKCLVGAVTSVRASSGGASWVPSEEIKAAKHFIQMAVRERGGSATDSGIMFFNDTRLSYRQIAEVIARAKQLATISHNAHAQRQRPAPVVPVIAREPMRQAPVAPLALPPPGGSRFFDRAILNVSNTTAATVNAWAKDRN